MNVRTVGSLAANTAATVAAAGLAATAMLLGVWDGNPHLGQVRVSAGLLGLLAALFAVRTVRAVRMSQLVPAPTPVGDPTTTSKSAPSKLGGSPVDVGIVLVCGALAVHFLVGLIL